MLTHESNDGLLCLGGIGIQMKARDREENVLGQAEVLGAAHSRQESLCSSNCIFRRHAVTSCPGKSNNLEYLLVTFSFTSQSVGKLAVKVLLIGITDLISSDAQFESCAFSLAAGQEC